MTYTNTIKKAAGASNTNCLHTDINSEDFRSHGAVDQVLDGSTIAAPQDLALTTSTTEPRVDSRLLAQQLDNKHKHVIALIDKYRRELERFAKVVFKKAPSAGRTGQIERFALLTEDHAFFVLALSRNSDIVVNLKSRLIQAFSNARRVADIRKTESLPGYHQLHDALHLLALGSTNECHVHSNVNRLLNKFAGIESGQRARAALPQQALLIVGQLVATQQALGATDHHDAYPRIKNSLQVLTDVLALGVASHA